MKIILQEKQKQLRMKSNWNVREAFSACKILMSKQQMSKYVETFQNIDWIDEFLLQKPAIICIISKKYRVHSKLNVKQCKKIPYVNLNNWHAFSTFAFGQQKWRVYLAYVWMFLIYSKMRYNVLYYDQSEWQALRMLMESVHV